MGVCSKPITTRTMYFVTIAILIKHKYSQNRSNYRRINETQDCHIYRSSTNQTPDFPFFLFKIEIDFRFCPQIQQPETAHNTQCRTKPNNTTIIRVDSGKTIAC